MECLAILPSGQQCPNKAVLDGFFCWQHTVDYIQAFSAEGNEVLEWNRKNEVVVNKILRPIEVEYKDEIKSLFMTIGRESRITLYKIANILDKELNKGNLDDPEHELMQSPTIREVYTVFGQPGPKEMLKNVIKALIELLVRDNKYHFNLNIISSKIYKADPVLFDILGNVLSQEVKADIIKNQAYKAKLVTAATADERRVIREERNDRTVLGVNSIKEYLTLKQNLYKICINIENQWHIELPVGIVEEIIKDFKRQDELGLTFNVYDFTEYWLIRMKTILIAKQDMIRRNLNAEFFRTYDFIEMSKTEMMREVDLLPDIKDIIQSYL